MDYVFGTRDENEVLKIKGDTHTNMIGFQQIEQIYPNQTITDRFRVVRKLNTAKDAEGNCYDWYEIDHHYRMVDKTAPLETQMQGIEDVLEAIAEA